MQKVLVTGGAGYIAAHTAAELVNCGYDVVLVDNFSRSDTTLLEGLHKITGKQLPFFEGDCADKKFLQTVFTQSKGITSVLHFAAFKAVGESVEKPLLYYQNNLNSLLSLLEVMKENQVTDLIFSSSCTVYGQPDQIPVNEHAPFKSPESPYGSTKQMCERILQDSVPTGFKVISLRYFNPIGAHPSGNIGELPVGTPNNLVPYITQTAAGIRKQLTIFGSDYNTPDGSCVRDFIHVSDLAVGHIKAMEYLNKIDQPVFFEAFNLGTGVGVSVLQLVQSFVRVTGINLPFTVGPRRPGDVEQVYADPSKSMDILGFSPKYSLDDSLQHAWLWEKKVRNIS
jgi:UDP-glucose 4-epimerase